MNSIIFVNSAIQLVFAVFFFLIADIFLRRKMRSEYRLPSIMFGLWWGITAFLATLQSIRNIISQYEIFALSLPLLYIHGILIIFAIFCLVYYIFFLYAGKSKWSAAIVLFYIVVMAIAVWALATGEATVIKGTEPIVINGSTYYPGEVRFPVSDTFTITMSLAIYLPQVIVCIALYALYFRIKEPTQKFRVLMIATGILLMFSTLLVEVFAEGINRLFSDMALRIISLASGIMIYSAYRPPKFIKKKLGVISVDEENSADSAGGE